MSSTCILLAAGASSRFGSQKLLHTMPNGSSMLRTCVKQYMTIADKLIVVINQNHALAETIDDLAVDIHINTHTDLGISESIRLGVLNSQDKQHFLFALADMPYIETRTIKLIFETLNHAMGPSIIVPCYRKRRGNPVGLSYHFKEQLLDLTGDTGARTLFKTYAACLTELQVQDKGVLFDIDYTTDIL